MPNSKIRAIFLLRLYFLIILTHAFLPTIQANEGIAHYYIRYDVKSSKNQIIMTHLTMIPATNEFRAENYSQKKASGAISAGPIKSKDSIEKQIRENALRTILVSDGLKSIKSRDYETVISYEGSFISPIRIVKNEYDGNQKVYVYEAFVEFSPIAFPDHWNFLNIKNKVKNGFEYFFDLFQ